MIIGYDGKKAVLNLTGIGNYSRRCLYAVSALWPDCQFILLCPAYTKPEAWRENAFIKLVTPPWLLRRGLLYEVWRNFLLWRVVKKKQMNIYHGLSNELPFWIEKSGCRSIVTIHDLIFLRHPEWYDKTSRYILRWKTKHACRVADRIIAVSEQTKEDIIHFYGIEPNRIKVVYQSYNPIFDEILATDIVRMKCETYNLPPSYILCVGSIEQRKNQEILIKALPYLPKHLCVVFVGKETPYQEKLRLTALNNKLISRVYFCNHIPTSDLPAFYQGARMAVYMSRYEGFGIPVIEALASSVPVIAAKGSCLEEAGGPDSLYLSPDNPEDLAKAIRELDTNENLRLRMITHGKEYVKRFSDQRHAEELIQLYSDLLKT